VRNPAHFAIERIFVGPAQGGCPLLSRFSEYAIEPMGSLRSLHRVVFANARYNPPIEIR
jgi:hypothetical protein